MKALGAPILGVAAIIATLSQAQAPESKPPSMTQTEQVHAGSFVWEAHCARCHDFDRLRPGFSRYGGDIRERELAWHGTTELLAHYVINYMPFDKPNTLTEAEYDEVLAYLLDRAGLLPEGIVVWSGTYPDIPLPDYRALSREIFEINAARRAQAEEFQD